MKNLFAKHISEIGENQQHISKYAKGNIVPQKRMSIDKSATLFNVGDIGVGREDFWIIKADKNNRNSWKPLGLKNLFSELQGNSFQWIFWGEGTIVFELNKKFEKNYSPSFNVGIFNNSARILTFRTLWKDYSINDSCIDIWKEIAKDLEIYLGTQQIDVSTIIADKRENGTDYIPQTYKTPTEALVWELALLLEKVVKIQNEANGTFFRETLLYSDIQNVAKQIDNSLKTQNSTPQPENFKPIWRFKTEQEFIDEFGDDWKIKAQWNGGGRMDYLFGKAIMKPDFDPSAIGNGTINTFDEFGIESGENNEWTMFPQMFKKIKPQEQPETEKPKPTKEISETPITIDIKNLEEEYNDVMFLIDVTPKVDVVLLTELKQRAYDLKKQINQKHLERTDVMLKENNIFFKLFESSSVEPIFRYDMTPDPNAFAPDGTPTTLPKTIYELCQTQDFISWFGDYRSAYNYRNSPFSEVPCSVVRTEHYEPLIVFHGTGSEFSYFNFDKFPAMYFAQNFSYAEWFAEQKGGENGTIGYVYPFLLNIRNYLDLTDFGINEISYQEFADSIFLQTGLEPEELKINNALLNTNQKTWAWVYLRNSPEFLKTLRDLKLFDGIIYYEQNPPINPTAPNYMTKGFIIFEPQNAKIVAPNRKELILPSMRSFYLKKGGKL